ncbi:MAG: hypothetical protein QNJ70_12040 [Xenococcaceae cyanobacterium MO_207.B15]|nr:hypothetical protein [Xenococcaceae cyanobacterium MO_207.B15]
MFGTRQLFVNTKNSWGQLQISQSDSAAYLKKVLAQTKKISQIIAYIWLNDNETSSDLEYYFKRPKLLGKLLLAQPDDPQYKLLQEVFKKHPDSLPIFDQSEKGFYTFKVIFNQFEGYLSDPDIGEEAALITMNIPYPPRPQIYDDLSCDPPPPLANNDPLKASELKNWLEQNPNEPPFFDEDNPYIPSTCS